MNTTTNINATPYNVGDQVKIPRSVDAFQPTVVITEVEDQGDSVKIQGHADGSDSTGMWVLPKPATGRIDHTNCTHDRTKAGRTWCRRQRASI